MRFGKIWMIWSKNYCNSLTNKWSLLTSFTFTQKDNIKLMKIKIFNSMNGSNVMIKTMTKYLSSKNGPFWMSLNKKHYLIWPKFSVKKNKSKSLRRNSHSSKKHYLLTRLVSLTCRKLEMRIRWQLIVHQQSKTQFSPRGMFLPIWPSKLQVMD